MQIPNDATAQLDQIVKVIGIAVGTFIIGAFVFVGVLLHEARSGKLNGKNSTITR